MSQPTKGFVKTYPGENSTTVLPPDGAIACCGIYGVFEHTGIWVEGRIVELHGSGLVKAVSPERFLDNRSGSDIYILCDQYRKPLGDEEFAERAVSKVFTYIDYHLLHNNCHRFVAECVIGQKSAVSSFYDLNVSFYQFFKTPLCWQPIR